jgi:hypothetical protein
MNEYNFFLPSQSYSKYNNQDLIWSRATSKVTTITLCVCFCLFAQELSLIHQPKTYPRRFHVCESTDISAFMYICEAASESNKTSLRCLKYTKVDILVPI